MRLIVKKGPSWSCQLCHNRANASSSALCSICGAGRPQHRFAIQLDGKYYLCKVKSALNGWYISVCHITTTSCGSFSIRLDENVELGDVNLLALVEEFLVEQAASKQNSMNGTAVERDYFGIPDDGDIPESSCQTDIDHGPGGAKHERTGSFTDMFNPGRSLFETVMHNATTVAYNAKIGQFVSVETIQPEESAEQEIGGEGSSVRSSWSYVESMRKEQVVMRQVVQEVVRKRADDTYLYDSHADLDINRNEWDKELECAMCERSYPRSQMPGQISFKAIADWKARHGAPLPPSDHRLDLIRLHDATRLCCFCTQFFDTNALDLVDRHALQERVGLTGLHLNGPLNCSNTVYKRMFRKAVAKVADVEDRPLSRMRHRVALEQLKFRAQFKNQTEARYIFNPKFPNLILDQEKVGSYLRTKYAGKSTTGTLLLAERKSVKLKPLDAPSATGEGHARNAAFLTESTTASSAHQDKQRQTSSAAIGIGPDSSSIRRSRSQSAKPVHSKTDRHRIVGRGRATITGPGASVQRARSDSTITHTGGGGTASKRKETALSQVNQAYQKGLHSTAPELGSQSPGKATMKSVSFGEKSDADQEPTVLKVRRKKRQTSVGTSKETRKPLILKVNAASVVGSQELGGVLEIELDSEKARRDPTADATAREEALPTAQPTRTHVLNPLRGLLSNMQITKVAPVAVRPGEVQSTESPTGKTQNYIIIDRSPMHVQTDGTKDAIAFSPTEDGALSPVAVMKGFPLQHERSPKGQVLPVINRKAVPSKGSKLPSKASTHGHGCNAGWKKNINKPVLRDVFDSPPRGQGSGTQQNLAENHSYITQVPENDHFIIDGAYQEDADHDQPPADSDHYSDSDIESLPDEDQQSPAARHVARTSSFNGEALDNEYEEYDYEDDDFEADVDGSPGELLDALYEGESMDRYNWVSAGPYQPPEDNGDLEDAGFSPVKWEASLFGTSPDRMRLLSRGSAGGLFSPVSRGVSSARRYSSQHTPMMLSSRGGGIAPTSPAATTGMHRGAQHKLGRGVVKHGEVQVHTRGSAKVPVVRRMEAVPAPHQRHHHHQLGGAGKNGQSGVRRPKG